MRRLTVTVAVAVVALLAAASAFAARTRVPRGPTRITGVLSSFDGTAFTVQIPGAPTGVLHALTVAANHLVSGRYPYVWGGGHAEAGIASVGQRGPGHNGRRRGYDCSGAVAAVLAGAGLWPVGMWVPNDAGLVRYLRRRHVLARGAGRGPRQVTLYDKPGAHIFMNIGGRFFGTSDGGAGGNPKGGPGWLAAGPDVTSRRFRRYHFVPRVLHAKTSAGYVIGFQAGSTLGLLDEPLGSKVSVTYTTTRSGMLVAQTITAVGELTASGTVASIAPDGSSVVVTTPAGATLSFALSPGSPLADQLLGDQLVVGDTVTIGYLDTPPAPPALLSLIVTATPPPAAPLPPGRPIPPPAAPGPPPPVTAPPSPVTAPAPPVTALAPPVTAPAPHTQALSTNW